MRFGGRWQSATPTPLWIVTIAEDQLHPIIQSAVAATLCRRTPRVDEGTPAILVSIECGAVVQWDSSAPARTFFTDESCFTKALRASAFSETASVARLGVLRLHTFHGEHLHRQRVGLRR